MDGCASVVSEDVSENDMPELEDVTCDTLAAVTSNVGSAMECQMQNCEKTDSAEEDDDEDWVEDDEESELDDNNATCLFCPQTFRSCKMTFAHCMEQHRFDIGRLKWELGLDYLSYIRLINYLRRQQLVSFADVIEPELRAALSDDANMKPMLSDDALLMFDIDELPDQVAGQPSIRAGDDESASHLLLTKLASVEACLRETTGQLEHAHDVIERMKTLALERLESGGAGGGFDLPPRCAGCDASAVPDENDSYFSSYAHFGIHHEMLQDRVRTVAYRDAILLNPTAFRGRRVLDVGCGTGILSMFAARCGAETVVGVDQSEIVYQAMDIVRENNLEGTVSLLRGRVEDVDLPFDKADVIVSEWMGYFLLFEGMLDSVIYARDKYLRPGGSLLPNRCTLLVAGVSDSVGHGNLITCWDDVYGFKMTCLKSEVVREAGVATVEQGCLITNTVLIKDFDLMTCTVADLQFAYEFTLTPNRSGPLTAFAGWFDSYFDLEEHKVCLSTAPSETPTHWRQTLFYLKDPINLTEGVSLNCKVTCRRLANDERSLKVTFVLDGCKFSYFLR